MANQPFTRLQVQQARDRCPFCGSHNIVHMGGDVIADDETFGCESCGKEWGVSCVVTPYLITPKENEDP